MYNPRLFSEGRQDEGKFQTHGVRESKSSEEKPIVFTITFPMWLSDLLGYRPDDCPCCGREFYDDWFIGQGLCCDWCQHPELDPASDEYEE